MKKKALLFALLLMGATVAKAQAAQPDFDDKYATELVKAGTAAPDFKMKTPDGKNFQFSKFATGWFLMTGTGVPVDEKKGLKWIHKATFQGYQPAIDYCKDHGYKWY